MFRSARIRLAAWYVLIMLSISILVSSFVFAAINEELRRIEYIQQSIEVNGRIPASVTMPRGPMRVHIMPLDTNEVRARILTFMVLINVGLGVFVGLVSYFLAGKTLQPIQEMVTLQKRFIADASHELRTPLTSLKTATEVSLLDKKLTLSQAKVLLKENLVEVNHMQVLTENLLRLSTLETLTQPLMEKLSLSEVLSAARKKVSPLAKEKSITINSPKIAFFVMGDSNALKELFVILLDNGIKYSPAHTTITIQAHRSRSNAVIEIIDEGIGINTPDLPKIFDRFYRADTSRTGNAGYGLGLSIAKKIIQQHRGSITARNNPNKGSTFTVALPLQK